MFLMSRRVSRRLEEAATPLVNWRSKCLIHTVPVGNTQLFVGLKPMSRLVSGTENQRDLMASSDQNGTLISYGTIPGFRASGVVQSVIVDKFVNTPAPDRFVGMAVPVKVLLYTKR